VRVELIMGEVVDTALQNTTTDNGYYLFSSVAPGSYYVKVYAPSPEYIRWTASSIEVTSKDVSKDMYLPKLLNLVSPDNDALVTSLIHTLYWEAINEATEYRIQINTYENWELVEMGHSASSNYTIKTELIPGVEYAWQVDAYDAENHCVGTTQMAYHFTLRAPLQNIYPVAVINGPYSGEEDSSVSFSSAGSRDPDGEISEYRWTFGDGTHSYEQNPSHTYFEPGTYTVRLRVTDNAGATDSETTTCTVTPTAPTNQDPVAAVNGPYSGEEDSSISFSSAGSHDPDGSIVEYRWDFGDGQTSTSANPSHTYQEAGTYTVKLTVTDDQSTTDTSIVTCVISPKANIAPIPKANGPYEGKLNQAISFSAEGSSDPDGILIEYRWDFGDGTFSNEKNPTHTYSKEGDYTVTLTVTDEGGLTSTDTINCQVILPAQVNLIPIVAGGSAVAVLVVALYLKKKRPEDVKFEPIKLEPTLLQVRAQSHELVADGMSKTTIYINLLDENGSPKKATEDMEITLTTTLGNITSPIIISKGESQGKATLFSSKEFGAGTISAESTGLETASTSIVFLEKRRYCMICGASIALDALVCPRCGRTPPSDVDVKTCKNCGNIIPMVADYCSECGANQPK